MNKNISVWRGSDTPPTKYHLWLKDDNKLYKHIQDNLWKSLSDNSGVKIVSSLDELDPDAPQGSLASVAVNTIGEVKFSELYQPTSDEVNMGTLVVDTTNLSRVSGISINSSYDTSAELQNFAVYLFSKDFNMQGGVGQVIGLMGFVALTINFATQEQNQLELFTANEDGALTVNEENLVIINNLLSSTEFVYGGVVSADNGEFIGPSYADVFYKAIGSISKTDLYIKKVEGWKVVGDGELKEQIDDLKTSIENLEDKTDLIVNSVDELPQDAPQGTLASVTSTLKTKLIGVPTTKAGGQLRNLVLVDLNYNIGNPPSRYFYYYIEKQPLGTEHYSRKITVVVEGGDVLSLYYSTHPASQGSRLATLNTTTGKFTYISEEIYDSINSALSSGTYKAYIDTEDSNLASYIQQILKTYVSETDDSKSKLYIKDKEGWSLCSPIIEDDTLNLPDDSPVGSLASVITKENKTELVPVSKVFVEGGAASGLTIVTPEKVEPTDFSTTSTLKLEFSNGVSGRGVIEVGVLSGKTGIYGTNGSSMPSMLVEYDSDGNLQNVNQSLIDTLLSTVTTYTSISGNDILDKYLFISNDTIVNKIEIYTKNTSGWEHLELVDGSVTTEKVADGAITSAKIAAGVLPTKTSELTNDSGFLTEHQDISGKQDVLISGENIKTINGESILGEGDISSGFIKGEGEGSAILNGSKDCSATGDYSIAGGEYANATGEASVALGRGCEASGRGAIALGGVLEVLYVTGKAGSTTYTANSYINEYFVGSAIVVPGDYNNKVATILSVSGSQFTVDKSLSANSDLENYKFSIIGCNAQGISSIALGSSFKSIGTNSSSEGRLTVADGTCSHAEGTRSLASGDYSHSEGVQTIAEGKASHAEGNYIIAKGLASHAEGTGGLSIYFTGNNKIYTVETGYNIQNSFSFVKGIVGKSILNSNNTIIATVLSSKIADDGYTISVTLDTDLGELKKAQYTILFGGAYGNYSHSENISLANGESSHAQGEESIANGNGSFIHGSHSVADGITSAVFGTNNYAQNTSEFALGISNHSHTGETPAEQTLFSVGCGDWQTMGMDARIANQIPLPTPEDGKNAIEIMRNGDVWLGEYGDGIKLYDGDSNKLNLADVATTGSYNDLSDKPTIPSAVTESTVSGWGFTKNTGTYSKPSGGIPKSDLASAVQTSLGKADTALQSYTEQYKGTVTSVKINGAIYPQLNGIVDLGTVITSHQDISGKQDKLVSGTNIKTINGTSILGSGDITIQGGGTSLIEVSSNPKEAPTDNTIAINTSNGKVFFGIANKGWWFVTSRMLGSVEIDGDTLKISAEYDNGTISVSGEVKDGLLIL